jgi:hypothetical protein
MEWLDAHAGSVQAVATLVLVGITAYYAYASRAQVREARMMLQATARATLQNRMNRLSEIMIEQPNLFDLLDDPTATGAEQDARFHLANMFLSILEEAHTQWHLERSMPEDDWRAWVATADLLLNRRFMHGYWDRARDTYEPSFQRFVDERFRRFRQNSPD